MSVDAPTQSDDYGVLTDWLELIALFSERRKARLDLINSAFDIGEDTPRDNIAEDDAETEDHNANLSEEVSRRTAALNNEAYPFIMSDNGEELTLSENLSYGQKAYLASLIHQHSRNSGKLSGDFKMTGTEAVDGRNKFEIFAVFATHGYCNGGDTFYIGSNRNSQENLLEMLRHASDTVGEGIVKGLDQLPVFAPAQVNDGGVDVIGVRQEQDGPPGIWYFGQSAAGADYVQKSAKTEVAAFCNLWYATAPANVEGLMLVAFDLKKADAHFHSPRLGHILHRLRLPLHAQNGRRLYDNDNSKVHFVANPEAPCEWLDDYVKRVRAL